MAVKSTRITINLPSITLARAMALTGKGITATVVEALEALEALERMSHRSALRALRGKVKFELDLARTRR